MKRISSFIVAGTIAINVPIMISAQVVVSKDTVVSRREDTVVHVRQDTAVVTTTVSRPDGQRSGEDMSAVLTRLPNYKTLTMLLRQSGLLRTLSGGAKFTLFAPTDEAFARLDPSQLSALKSDSAGLSKLLLNHVVSGVIDSREILKLKTATTLEGSRIRFTYKNGKPLVNEHAVVQPGIVVSNGIIHGIDGVINL